MQSAGTVHMRQQVLEELKVPFTVEDDHGYAMRLLGRTDNRVQDPAR